MLEFFQRETTKNRGFQNLGFLLKSHIMDNALEADGIQMEDIEMVFAEVDSLGEHHKPTEKFLRHHLKNPLATYVFHVQKHLWYRALYKFIYRQFQEY